MSVVPPIDKDLAAWLQAVTWVATGGGVIITLIKFWSEQRLRAARVRNLRN